MKVYNNTKAVGTQGVRSTALSSAPGIDLSGEQKLANATSDLVRTQSQNEGVTEYMKWSEEASAKEVELTAKNGSNAVGLQTDFDAWNKDYHNNMQFKDRDSENAFLDRANLDTLGTHKRLNTYEASEAVEYKAQLDMDEVSKGYANAYVALENGDSIDYDINKARADVAAQSLYAGRPDIDSLTKDLRSKSLSQIASNKVSSGDAANAKRMIDKAHGAGDISDIDKLSFDLGNKHAIATSQAEDIHDTIRNTISKNYTKREWAEINGGTVPDSEADLDSGMRKSELKVSEEIGTALRNYDFKSDEFFVGDSDYNKDVNNELLRYYDEQKKVSDADYKKRISGMETDINAGIYDYYLNPTEEKFLNIRQGINSYANQTGEHTKALKFMKGLDKEVKTDAEAYNDVYAKIKASNGMISESDINDAALGTVSVKSLNGLYDFSKKLREENFSEAMDSLTIKNKNSLGLNKKKEKDWSPSEKLSYQKVSEASTNYLLKEYSGEKLPEESVTRALQAGMSARKIVNIDDEDQELTLYNKTSSIKEMQKSLNVSDEQFDMITRAAINDGVVDESDLEEYLFEFDLSRKGEQSIFSKGKYIDSSVRNDIFADTEMSMIKDDNDLIGDLTSEDMTKIPENRTDLFDETIDLEAASNFVDDYEKLFEFTTSEELQRTNPENYEKYLKLKTVVGRS